MIVVHEKIVTSQNVNIIYQIDLVSKRNRNKNKKRVKNTNRKQNCYDLI